MAMVKNYIANGSEGVGKGQRPVKEPPSQIESTIAYGNYGVICAIIGHCFGNGASTNEIIQTLDKFNLGRVLAGYRVAHRLSRFTDDIEGLRLHRHPSRHQQEHKQGVKSWCFHCFIVLCKTITKNCQKTTKTPNSYFFQKALLEINELEARNSDFSFRKKGRNRVGTSLFVEVGAVFKGRSLSVSRQVGFLLCTEM